MPRKGYFNLCSLKEEYRTKVDRILKHSKYRNSQLTINQSQLMMNLINKECNELFNLKKRDDFVLINENIKLMNSKIDKILGGIISINNYCKKLYIAISFCIKNVLKTFYYLRNLIENLHNFSPEFIDGNDKQADSDVLYTLTNYDEKMSNPENVYNIIFNKKLED